jgi:phosphoglycerate dehydrogenase-like enzyme
MPADAPGRPARLLLSRATLGRLEAALRRIAPPSRLETVALEDVADDPAVTVDAVFISRDITGTSTKAVVGPTLAACYGVIRRSPQLRWVHTHSAGADRPIYPEIAARGVAVSTSQGANADSVAHTAVGAVLALGRGFPGFWAAQGERRWAPFTEATLPRDLSGQTAVVLGFGPIGQRIARWLHALGLRIEVVRQGAQPADTWPTWRYADLPDVLPRADWLVLACPLTPQTEGLVDAAALGRLPPGAHLVNVARGEVVVQSALVEALSGGRLGGAFLDVFDPEPLDPASPLWRLPGVVVTPHAAGRSAGHAARVDERFLSHLQDWLAGRPVGTALLRPAQPV